MTDKETLALDLMIESVIEPDHVLRTDAMEQGCFQELMEWRQQILDYLYTKHDKAKERS